MKRSVAARRIALTAVLIGGTVIGTPMVSANASNVPAFCKSGNVCAFEETQLQGCQMNFATPDTDFSNNNYHSGLPGCEDEHVNDTVQSIWNDSSSAACFYINKNDKTYGQKIAAKATAKTLVHPNAYSSWKHC